jgi:proteic killer suppression protein
LTRLEITISALFLKIQHYNKALVFFYRSLTAVTWQVAIFAMIKTFSDKETQQLFIKGKSKRLPPDLIRRALRRLEYINLAITLDDLKVPPSNRLHALKGNREEQFSISINDQWRICFRFVDGDAYDVEITDYH